MICHLLDVNLLIALAWPQHVHHAAAHNWFSGDVRGAWATCPITQIGFVRVSSNPKIIPDATAPRDALSVLTRIISLPGHRFWPDGADPTKSRIFTSLTLVGHRQVTDAYLLELALENKGKLATLDRGVAELAGTRFREKLVTLVPSSG